jgi:hypothetical protein
MGAGPPLQCKLFQWQKRFACDCQKGPSMDEQIFHVEVPSNRKNQDLKCFYVLEKVPLVVIYHVHRVMLGVNISSFSLVRISHKCKKGGFLNNWHKYGTFQSEERQLLVHCKMQT